MIYRLCLKNGRRSSIVNITLLGTGTCQIEKDRMASSVFIEIDDMSIVFDFGRGVSQRIYDLSLKQDDIQHIVISHFHSDHISDTIPFLHAGLYSPADKRCKDLNIYGPDGIGQKMGNIFGIVGREDIQKADFKINVHEITYERFSIGNMEFQFIRLSHDNNHGLKYMRDGEIYAFTGDIAFDEKEIGFLRGADFAIVNVGHLRDEDIIEMSVLTQVKTIVCSHLYGDLDEDRLNSMAKKKGYIGRIVIGKDLMRWTDIR